MTDRPILFSGPMVRAIIAGCKQPGTGKTQTRRVMTLPNSRAESRRGSWEVSTVGGTGCYTTNGHPFSETACLWHPKAGTIVLPGYAVGDRLWVRECVRYDWTERVWLYNADREVVGDQLETPTPKRWPTGTCPSIFLPRPASRITLTVTDVRVQRLQEISEADAEDEGIIMNDGRMWHWDPVIKSIGFHSARSAFDTLWTQINGKRDGCKWTDNPWIVAVTFKPELRNIGAVQRVLEEARP